MCIVKLFLEGQSKAILEAEVTPHSRFRKRYRRTLGLVLALEALHYRPALATAEQLGSFWRSLPQLNDANGLNQMATECDKLVATLQLN
jgi:hypothetical protein